MRSHDDTAQAASTARAIDRVLGAEREAEASLAQARQQAHDALEQAREDALAAVNRAMDRVAAWQQAHGAALERRLAALRESDAVSARASRPPDEAAIAAAVAHVTARLTGGDDHPGAHDDRP